MRCLRRTLELSGRRRQDAMPWLAKMFRVPPDRAWWPAVGAPLERGVLLSEEKPSPSFSTPASAATALP
jgi:hypothetical protein